MPFMDDDQEMPFDDWLPGTAEKTDTLESLGYVKPANDYVRKQIPSDFIQFLKSQKVSPAMIAVWISSPGDVYICGGALRNYYSHKLHAGEDTKVNDIDMYFKTAEALERTRKYLVSFNFEEVAWTERAITLIPDEEGPAVQLVKSICGTLPDVLNDFDFSVTRTGASAEELVMYSDFEAELINRTLRYCGSRTPLRSLARAVKYIRYGYQLSIMDMTAIVRDISLTVDFNSSENVETHLKGISKKFAEAKDVGKAVGEIS